MRLLTRRNLLFAQIGAAVAALILTILSLSTRVASSSTVPIVASLVGCVFALALARAAIGRE